MNDEIGLQEGDIVTAGEIAKIERAEKDAARWRELCRGMISEDTEMLNFLDTVMPADNRTIEHMNIAMDLWLGRKK